MESMELYPEDLLEKAALIHKQLSTVSEFDTPTLKIHDIVELFDLRKPNPQLFQQLMLAVDPMTDSSEVVLGKVSAAFASASTTVVEVGAGIADRMIVQMSWRMHQRLLSSSQAQGTWTRTFVYSAMALSFLATLTSVLVPIVESEEVWDFATGWSHQWWWHYFDIATIVLPALSTIVNTMGISMAAVPFNAASF